MNLEHAKIIVFLNSGPNANDPMVYTSQSGDYNRNVPRQPPQRTFMKKTLEKLATSGVRVTSQFVEKVNKQFPELGSQISQLPMASENYFDNTKEVYGKLHQYFPSQKKISTRKVKMESTPPPPTPTPTDYREETKTASPVQQLDAPERINVPLQEAIAEERANKILEEIKNQPLLKTINVDPIAEYYFVMADMLRENVPVPDIEDRLHRMYTNFTFGESEYTVLRDVLREATIRYPDDRGGAAHFLENLVSRGVSEAYKTGKPLTPESSSSSQSSQSSSGHGPGSSSSGMMSGTHTGTPTPSTVAYGSVSDSSSGGLPDTAMAQAGSVASDGSSSVGHYLPPTKLDFDNTSVVSDSSTNTYGVSPFVLPPSVMSGQFGSGLATGSSASSVSGLSTDSSSYGGVIPASSTDSSVTDGGTTTNQQPLQIGTNARPVDQQVKYHIIPITIFFKSAKTPEWDNQLESTIRSLTIDKSVIADFLDALIAYSGPKFLVLKRKSDGDIQELVEVLELHFKAESISNGVGGNGPGVAEISVADLINLATGTGGFDEANTPQPVSQQPIEYTPLDPMNAEVYKISEAWRNGKYDSGQPLTNITMENMKKQPIEIDLSYQEEINPLANWDQKPILGSFSIRMEECDD